MQTYKMADAIVRLRRCMSCQYTYFTTEKKDKSNESNDDKTPQNSV